MTRTLAVIALVLIAIGVATSFLYDAVDRTQDWWFRFVDVNGEANLPSWYSVVLLAGTALLLFAIARVRCERALGKAKDWSLLGWFVVAMSLDEMASIHEAVGGQVDRQVALPVIGGYGWIVPGAIIAAGAGLVGWRVIQTLPGPAKRALAAAAVLFVLGALALEVVEAILTGENGAFGAAAKLTTGAQELFEMLGVVLALGALTRELRRVSVLTVAQSTEKDVGTAIAA
jgi:hypothetical protein